jgi:beta-lactamase superfamily II metal-dependent hydrolase
MKKTFLNYLLISQLIFAGEGIQAFAGTPLPPWSEGCLDIHAINSARGECTFFIFPDGTSMVVDAGDISVLNPKYPKVPPKPDSLSRPSTVYARYIRHFLPGKAKGKLDYAMVSHYHIDHFKAIAELYEEIPFRTLVDRSWPDYSDERYVAKSNMDFYTSFVKRLQACGRKNVLCFKPGRSDQIVLRHKPRRYRNFNVFNFAAGGIVWDGEKCIDPYEGKQVKENGASCCFLLSYGDFDYYTGGDAGGNSKVALPVARAIGRQIDAMKADHHLSHHTMEQEQMDILQPSIVVTQSFFVRDIQPDLPTMRRLLSDYPDMKFFFTNIAEEMQKAAQDVFSKAYGMNGHIVIRVLPGGTEYMVYVLDDNDYQYNIKSEFGPFRSKP